MPGKSFFGQYGGSCPSELIGRVAAELTAGRTVRLFIYNSSARRPLLPGAARAHFIANDHSRLMLISGEALFGYGTALSTFSMHARVAAGPAGSSVTSFDIS